MSGTRLSAATRGYGKKWQRARREFLDAYPRCSTPGCPNIATVVDHHVPHKGDLSLFWNRRNWRPRCAPCHNRKTVQRDGGFGRPVKRGGFDRNGRPLDPKHHWNAR